MEVRLWQSTIPQTPCAPVYQCLDMDPSLKRLCGNALFPFMVNETVVRNSIQPCRELELLYVSPVRQIGFQRGLLCKIPGFRIIAVAKSKEKLQQSLNMKSSRVI